ncbi:MAG: thioredoxin family protein [Labilithrix sp.]|nr:thioredoxin family protein [Labilithrix sp.]
MVAGLALSAVSISAQATGETPPAAPAALPGLPAAPWLGVQMDAGGDIGVTIEHVVRGSPADKAGMHQGDRIVTVDGIKTTAPGQVTRAVGQHKVGDTISVEVERRGTATTASVVLAQRPSGDEILKMDLVGAPAPAWTKVSALAGAPSSIAQLRGRVVLVDFWASWCGPCRMLAPRLSALKDKFGAQGLTVVGITTDDAEKAAVFAEKHQMRYPIVVDNSGDTSRSYGVSALPTMLLIDKKGIVREVFIGFDPSGDARLESTLKTLLAETAPPAAPLPPPAPSAPRPPAR